MNAGSRTGRNQGSFRKFNISSRGKTQQKSQRRQRTARNSICRRITNNGAVDHDFRSHGIQVSGIPIRYGRPQQQSGVVAEVGNNTGRTQFVDCRHGTAGDLRPDVQGGHKVDQICVRVFRLRRLDGAAKLQHKLRLDRRESAFVDGHGPGGARLCADNGRFEYRAGQALITHSNPMISRNHPDLPAGDRIPPTCY